jgi:hypothetical protein
MIVHLKTRKACTMAGEEELKGDAPSTMDNFEIAIDDQLKNLSGFLDGGINIASDALKSSTALVKDEVENVTGLAKVWQNFSDLAEFEIDI